jgi:hypothetical protein
MKFDILLRPQIALIFFIAILFIYIIILDKEGAFQKKFLNFGPSPDTKFFNISLETWPQVISVYFIAFLSSLSLSYYNNIASFFVNNILLNPAYKEPIRHSKFWSKILGIADPLINAIMTAINFFVTLTMEFQFIFCQLLGTIAISIPSNLHSISKKKFTLD